MRFVLYSEKTVTQCLTAINARMHVKGTGSRPTLDGWVEKNGAFSISMSAPVIGKFARRTVLKAKVERESGLTTIRGSVPHGVSRQGQVLIFVALALVAIIIISEGNALFGFLLIPFAAYLYIPLHGDYLNSEILIDEVQKTLKAKPKPPKKTTGESKPAAVKTVTRSAAPKTTATRAATTRATAAAPKTTATRATAAPKLPAAPRPAAQRALPAPKQVGFDEEFPPQDDDD
ncbi:MAG: hypothetical protein ABI700_04405 [Chloroflexota bacterium]